MAVWTIYNHGTNASSMRDSNEYEIVNIFGNNDASPINNGKIITEGVGSIGQPHNLKGEFVDWQTPHGPERTFETNQKSLPKEKSGMKGATGDGAQQNVDMVLTILEDVTRRGVGPTEINMLGWSRGGVTCIRIAYRLYTSGNPRLQNIPINIFAVDPVAGPQHNDEADATNIQGNVKNYFATLAMGEERRYFKPMAAHRLNINDKQETRAWILPMPGHHADVATRDNHSGKIVFNLAYRFLKAKKSNVKATNWAKTKDADTWKLYEDLMYDDGQTHQNSKGEKVVMGGVAYDRKDEVKAHNVDGNVDFFINHHAELVFASVYPQTWLQFFSPMNAIHRNTPEWVRKFNWHQSEEFRRMSGRLAKDLTDLAPAKGAAMMSSHETSMAVEFKLLDRV